MGGEGVLCGRRGGGCVCVGRGRGLGVVCGTWLIGLGLSVYRGNVLIAGALNWEVGGVVGGVVTTNLNFGRGGGRG